MFTWLSSFFGETSGCESKKTINYSKLKRELEKRKCNHDKFINSPECKEFINDAVEYLNNNYVSNSFVKKH
jgi:hypothetical protein